MILSGLILFIIAALAFALSTVCGGGAGLILIPVLGSFLPVTYVPAALSIGTASSSFSRIIVFYRNIRWDVVKWFVPAALPAVWLGAWLLSYVNPLYLQLLMGLFLVGNLPQLFSKKGETKSQPLLPSWVLMLIGFLSGFVSGLTGAVGLLFNRFYLRYGLTKEQIVATRAANELLLHIVKLCLYASFGLLTAKVLGFGLVVAMAAIVSSFAMKWILPLLSEGLFKRIGYGAMVLSGFMLLTESGAQIADKDNVSLNLVPISGGVETKMQWKMTNFSFEFVYDEGFEYEQVIALSDLPADKQAMIKLRSVGAEKVKIEEVFSFSQHSYEAYIVRNGKLEKFDFE